MRRLLSLVLLAAFGLPIVAPMFALGQDPDAGLPICCRRHGKHHCAMLEARNKESAAPSLIARCPFFPQSAVAPVTGAHLIVFHPPRLSASFAAAFAPAARTETHRPIARDSAHHKRGPPPELL